MRVPSLSKAGVTATCRTALLTLAVMDPLKQLLAAKGMLEVSGWAAWPAVAVSCTVITLHYITALSLQCASLQAVCRCPDVCFSAFAM